MKPHLVAALLALSIAPAAAQSVGEKSGVNSVLGIAPSTADFVLQAAQSDKFEIASSKLAEERGNEKSKAFAKQMVEAHTKTSEQLMSAASEHAKDVTPPSEMNDSQKSLLEKLKGLKGADFDEQFAEDQESAHKDAVSLFQRYGDGGDNAALKAWASTTLPDLQHHLQMAKALDD